MTSTQARNDVWREYELIILSKGGGIHAVALKTYPDGMPLITNEMLRFCRVERILLRPRSLTSFMAAMFLVDAIQERMSEVPELILPCMPGARQDRLNDVGDYLFTVKSIAREINLRLFSRVTLLDPHSKVGPALIDNCHVVRAADCIETPSGKYAAVVSPDAGAEERAGAVARKLGVPLLHGWKTRDVATGEISGFGLEPNKLPSQALVLVVDDCCDGGGTFTGLADVLDKDDLKAHLWVTHGVFTRGTAHLLERYGHVYCTDSVLGPREGVAEIPTCMRLLEDT